MRRERRTRARTEAEESSSKAKGDNTVAAKAAVIEEADKVVGLNVITVEDTANSLEESTKKEKLELLARNKVLERKAVTLEKKNEVLETINTKLEGI